MQKHIPNVIIKSPNKKIITECFCLINYNRLSYEIKRDLTNFTEKITKGISRTQYKFVTQILYGILAGNKVQKAKRQINPAQSVIIIDNSVLTKPCSPKMEAISDVHDGRWAKSEKGILQ